MLKAAKEQDFMAAARLRDELFALQNEFKKLYEHT
ncbi:MAG TPA: UvrB/UvrC motif-containing protein [Chitinophagales bacterium]|nr:UvrB/UvrC motif-containing protein [Chitinophagales bacterium]